MSDQNDTVMNFKKILILSVAVSLAALTSSCTKNVDKKHSVDIDLSFITTDEMANLTTRQYEILVNGATVLVTNITGADFSKSESLINLAAPATIDVKVTASFSGSEVPESIKARNTYTISAKCNGKTITNSSKDSQTTVTRENFSNYLSLMNHTTSLKLDENGEISKVK